MKRIFALFIAAAISIGASAATLLPIQLLNPAGSTSGQAIISTGASSAPAWGSVSAAALTGLVPVVNGGTGVGTSTGSGSVVLQTAPTINQPNLVGVTSGAAAAAGSVGQIITATATAVSLTSATPANATSISLTAGQWVVHGSCRFIPAGTTVLSSIFAGANTASATFPASPLFAVFTTSTGSAFTGSALGLTIPTQPFNVSTTTTVFLVVQSGFATSTLTVDCNLWAVRVR